MTNLYSVFLFLLKLCLCLLINPRAAAAEDLFKLKWINSLDTIEKLDAYMNSSFRMAKENLMLNKEGTSVVLGPSSTGDLTLSYCFKRMKTMQSEEEDQLKGLFLVVPSVEVFTKAVPEIRKMQCATWITFLFPVFKGPYGKDVTIPTWDIVKITDFKLLHTNRLALGFTTAYDGKDVDGYTIKILDEMNHYWDAGHFKSLDEFDFSLDIYHLSKTDFNNWDMFEYTKKAKRIEFFTNEAMQDKVNITTFRSFVGTMEYNISQCYFNVPEKFRNAYFDYEVNNANGVRGEMGVMIGLVLVVKGFFFY